MQCQQFKAQLGIFRDLPPASRKRKAILRHARKCPRCAREFEVELRLQNCLTQFPIPEKPTRLEDRVMSRALLSRSRFKRTGKKNRGIAIAVTSTAFVSSFALVAILTFWIHPFSSPRGANGLPQVTLTLHQARPVGFIFHVHQPLHKAHIVVNLPKGVAVYGRHDQQISWNGDLKAGANLLELPLVARKRGGGVITAEVNLAGSKTPVAQIRLVAHTRDSATSPGIAASSE